MRLTIILLLLIGLVSCSTEEHRQLDTDPTVTKIFDGQEISDLNKVLTFFQSQICSNKPTNHLDSIKCFRSYMESMKSNMDTDSIVLNIKFDSQKDFYKALNLNLFDEIWSLSWKIQSHSKYDKDTLRAINFNSSGKYMEFLKQTGEDYESISQYHDAVISAGGLSPVAIATLMAYPENYDIMDIRVRLIVAIHYLTLNDNIKRFERIKITAETGLSRPSLYKALSDGSKPQFATILKVLRAVGGQLNVKTA